MKEAQVNGPWRPLIEPLFRSLWIATVVSNVGTWIHEVGASWLMVVLDPSPLMVALVQSAASLPIFLFALPFGALVDIVDRRRLLIYSQIWMLVAAACLAAATYLQLMTPWLLLALTFMLGIGTAVSSPAWQAITPEIVSKPLLTGAITLNGVSINIARALGPAIGGVLVAAFGPWSAFALNALSFPGVLVVLRRWKRQPEEATLPPEQFVGAMWLGFRYVTHSASMIAVLVRALAFVFFASVLYALLPLVAREELGLTAWGYGMILGFVGAGAILGAAVLPVIRSRLGADARVMMATAAFAVSVFGLAFVRDVRWLSPPMILAGFSWLIVLSGLNVAVQSAVPSWVRGRALSVYLLVFFGGMSLGAFSWGGLASIFGITKASCVAGLGLLASLLTTFRFPLAAGEDLDLTPSGHWPVPAWCGGNAEERQPVIVTIEYRIDPKSREAFLQAVRPLRDTRLRDGGYNWSLARSSGDPSHYIEVFFVPSWVEHLRQHQRVTISDRQIQENVQRFHIGPNRPVAAHFTTESVYKPAKSP